MHNHTDRILVDKTTYKKEDIMSDLSEGLIEILATVW
jgi:hypothetical protein